MKWIYRTLAFSTGVFSYNEIEWGIWDLLQLSRSSRGLSPLSWSLFFSLLHGYLVWFRPEDWDDHDKSLILCSLNHFLWDFDIYFGPLFCWRIQTWLSYNLLAESDRISFKSLVVHGVHTEMHPSKVPRAFEGKTFLQHHVLHHT